MKFGSFLSTNSTRVVLESSSSWNPAFHPNPAPAKIPLDFKKCTIPVQHFVKKIHGISHCSLFCLQSETLEQHCEISPNAALTQCVPATGSIFLQIRLKD